jgi:hypothetical protein
MEQTVEGGYSKLGLWVRNTPPLGCDSGQGDVISCYFLVNAERQGRLMRRAVVNCLCVRA